MKRYLIAVVVLMFNSGYSQMQKLKLTATAGSQYNRFNSGFSTNTGPRITSFSLGAGSYFYFGSFFVGTEFQFIDGQQKNSDYRLSLSGLNSTLSVGYNILKSYKYSFEPNVGVVMMKNKVNTDNFRNNESVYFTKNSTGIVPAIDFSFTNASGLLYGVKIGYQIVMNENSFWKKGITNGSSEFSDPTNSFFIQVKVGGILQMKNNSRQEDTKTSIIESNHYETEMKTAIIDNNGDKLFTVMHPNPGKETIILLHGGPGFPSSLTEVINDLKDHFQIIFFHQRGTKKSPCRSGDYSMEAYLEDIEAVRHFYNIEKFHLWGHSWGGLYAQIYAEKYTDHLLSIFLCSPGSGTNVQWKQTEKEVMKLNKSMTTTWEWTKMGMNSFLGMLGSDNAYKRLFTQVMKNYNKKFVSVDASIIAEDFDLLKADPINKTRPAIVKYPLLKGLSHPDFKITILYGDQDIYTVSKSFVIDRYPTAKVVAVPNSGHIPWLHNPDVYKSIVSRHYK